jgi:hypothetical protein
LANLPDERVHHGIAVFTTHLNQHDKAGSPFHQRGDVAIFGYAQQISLPCVDAPFDASDIFDGLNM